MWVAVYPFNIMLIIVKKDFTIRNNTHKDRSEVILLSDARLGHRLWLMNFSWFYDVPVEVNQAMMFQNAIVCWYERVNHRQKKNWTIYTDYFSDTITCMEHKVLEPYDYSQL